MQTQTEPRVRTLCAPTLWVNWNQTKKRNTVFFPPCGVHIKSFLISSVPLSWMHARGQHVWGRTKSWWTLAVHHSSQERRTDPGAFTGLSPSHQAAASECERPHNPQSPPEPIAPSFLPSNSPLSIFFFFFFWKGARVCDSGDLFHVVCFVLLPLGGPQMLFCYISLTFSAPGPHDCLS